MQLYNSWQLFFKPFKTAIMYKLWNLAGAASILVTLPVALWKHMPERSFNLTLQRSASVAVQRSRSPHAAAATWNVPQSPPRSKSNKWGGRAGGRAGVCVPEKNQSDNPLIMHVALLQISICIFFYWLLLRKLIVFACVWSQDCMHSVIHSACAVHGAANIVTEVYCLDHRGEKKTTSPHFSSLFAFSSLSDASCFHIQKCWAHLQKEVNKFYPHNNQMTTTRFFF